MELIDTLFEGSPRFWGGGVAHSVMILAIVISLGLMLGRVKVKALLWGLHGYCSVGYCLPILILTSMSIFFIL